jgi:hypothetical protein
METAVKTLSVALAAARASYLPFETALVLDALEQLGAPGSSDFRRERDELLAQLDVVRLPGRQPARPRAAAAPAG